MKERIERWKGELARRRDIEIFERLRSRLALLSPGDRFIFYVLVGLALFAALLGLYTIEQSLLVTIPAYGGTLSEGEVGSPRFINPLLAISDADRDLTALTYAGLMGLKGDGALVPVLAESYTVSPDGKVYTFTLRDTAAFSDGTKVTASDVTFTVQKAQDPGLKSPEYANWSGISVVAVDSRTVRFTLSKPYAPFLELTTLGILPAHLWQGLSDEEFPFSTLETAPVGAGPFSVRSTFRDASGLIESLSLVRNSHYALGRPYLDGIRMNFYASTEDLAHALASGAIESAHGVPGAQVLTVSYARVFGVFFNKNLKGVYARLEVMKALSLSVDRQAIVDGVLAGYATPIAGPVPPGGAVVPAPVPASTDRVKDAAAVLTAAGWHYDGDARTWKNTVAKQTLDEITIRTSNVPELRSVALAVKAAWEKLGIPVNIELYEPGDLSQNVIRPRKYEALLYGEVIGRDQDLYAFWDSKETSDPGLNIALYVNKNVDILLEDARVNPDRKARIADLQKIENIIAGDYAAVFLYAPDFVYTVPKAIKGVELPQITTPSDRFATAASWYRVTDKVWPFFVPSK
ncbi:MAG: peptide ABC transporter substrate-binding protein [bacterium]|nr:peptide ABC transporter substrate-binding protein [bacterium]